MQYNLVSKDGFTNLTVFLDGELLSVTNEHPRFQAIMSKVLVDDTENLADMFSPVQAITKSFEKIGTRVTIRDGRVFYEGREVHNTLADQIVRFWQDGEEDYTPLVLFMEKLNNNPNEQSRDMLFDWLSAAELTINTDGNIVGYKAVNADLTSIHAGPGIVDGVQLDGNLPNNIGSVIEMDRDDVTFDPNNACAAGLHIGTYDYARHFGGSRSVILEVEVDPQDVVSVPAYEHSKLRACRYHVVRQVDKKYDEALVEGTGWSGAGFVSADVPAYTINESEGWGDFGAVPRPVVDTRENHIHQKRDANGRFVKK